MDFYQSLGPLILGSRLRRLSEYFLSEVNRVYTDSKIEFDASWFPIFYLLSKKKEDESLSIRELSNRIQVSHSAVSQLVSNLKRRQLIQTQPSNIDARVQLVELTAGGRVLLNQIKPIWGALENAVQGLAHEDPELAELLPMLSKLENLFSSQSLGDR